MAREFVSGTNKNGKQTVKGYKTGGLKQAIRCSRVSHLIMAIALCEQNVEARTKLLALANDLNAKAELITVSVVKEEGKGAKKKPVVKTVPISFTFNCPTVYQLNSQGLSVYSKESITFPKDVKEMLANNNIKEEDAKAEIINLLAFQETVLYVAVPESRKLMFASYRTTGEEFQPLFDAVEKACIKASGGIDVEKLTVLSRMITAHDVAGLTKALGASATKLLA